MTDQEKQLVKVRFTEVLKKVLSKNKTTDLISDDNLIEFFVQNMIGGWDKVFNDFELGLKSGNSIDEQLLLMEQIISTQQNMK
jgi:hypothetical protein